MRNAAAVRDEHSLPARGYDALVVDLYTGETPLELLTAESLGRLKQVWLKPGGVLCMGGMSVQAVHACVQAVTVCVQAVTACVQAVTAYVRGCSRMC